MKSLKHIFKVGMFLSVFVAFFGGFFSTNTTNAQFALEEDDPKCPAAPHLGLASVCGIVRSSSVDEKRFRNEDVRYTSHGIGGVTVGVYEAAPFTASGAQNPTGKFDGAIGHLFSSSYTTMPDSDGFNGGRFQVYKRRMGPLANTVYIAYFCNGQLSELRRHPSYLDEPEVIETVFCPDGSGYVPPPQILFYNDVAGHLACDMEADPYDDPVIYEAKHTETPRTTANFDLAQEGFDIRHTPMELIFGGWHMGWRGGWWRPDCPLQLDRLNRLINLPLVERIIIVHQVFNEACDWFPPDDEYKVANVLPLLPWENNQLAYRRVEHKLDHVYFQEETAIAQFLHTHMGECWGQIFKRKLGENIEPEYMDCGEFLNCTRLTAVAGSDRNSWTTGGYALGMGITTVYQNIYDMSLYLLAGDDALPVCEIKEGPRAGTEVFVQDIQPGWEKCELGTPGCNYILDRRYWHNLLPLLAADLKYPFTKENINDSLYAGAGEEGAGVRDLPVVPSQHAYVPAKGGLGAVFSERESYGLTGPTALSAVTTEIYGEELTKTFHIIGATDEELTAGHEAGKIGTPTEYCGFSFVNDQGVDIDQSNELAFFRTNQFDDDTPERAQFIKETPTSGVYYTSVAEERDALLARSELYYMLGDWVDSFLNAEAGDAEINLGNIPDYVSGFFSLLFAHLKQDVNPTKSMFDRVNATWRVDEVRDDLRMLYGSNLTEATFEDVFPTYQNEGLAFEGGQDACYPWHDIDRDTLCDVYPSPGGWPVGSMRTCKTTRCMRTWKIGRWVPQYSTVTLIGCTSTPQFSGPCPGDWEAWCPIEGEVRCVDEELTGYNWDINRYERECTTDEVTRECMQPQLDTWRGGNDPTTDPDAPRMERVEDPDRDHIEGPPGQGPCIPRYEQDGFDPNCEHGENPGHLEYYCDLERAGPYGSIRGAEPYIANEFCKGQLTKDATLRITQETIDQAAGDMPSDQMDVAQAEFIKTWSITGEWKNKVRTPVVGGFDSNSDAESEGWSKRNFGKDFDKGLGEGGKAISQAPFAFPMFTLVTITYPDTDFWCIDTNGVLPGGSGVWVCPVQTPPEDIVIEQLEALVDNNCKLNVSAACLSAMGMNDVSYTFETILNAAGSYFQVHPAAMVAYMKAVHNLPYPPFSAGWEETLAEASFPWYGKIPYGDCSATDADASTNDIGPYDYILSWFRRAVEGGGGAALDSLAEGRSQTASRCNFIDASFTAASQLSEGGSSCSDNWSTAREYICNMMWGSVRTGTYEDCPGLNFGDPAQQVFQACD